MNSVFYNISNQTTENGLWVGGGRWVKILEKVPLTISESNTYFPNVAKEKKTIKDHS